MTFELRTYTATPGKMDALLARFRDHTVQLFAEHGMESVGYWTSVDDPNVLVYILRHEGEPEENWTAFRADQRWIDVRAESEKPDGSLTVGIVSAFVEAADFSAIK